MNAAATGGMLQNQIQELFPSPIPVPDSNDMMMNLSISNTNNVDNSALKPLSLNAHGLLVSNNVDPIFSPAGTNPRASFNSFGGPNNNSPVPIGSTYSSATALLQKAAEMGAKISDNSIATILLRGFTGYSSSSMNSAISVQDGSCTASGPTSGGFPSGSYMGNLEAYDKAKEDGNQRITTFNASHSGIFDPNSLLMHSPNGNSGNIWDRQVLMGRGEKLTLDFLGVKPHAAAAAQSSFPKKRGFESEVIGLEYSKPSTTCIICIQNGK